MAHDWQFAHAHMLSRRTRGGSHQLGSEGGWPVLSEAAAESAGACTMAVIWMEQSAQHTAVLGILRADSVQICLNSCGLTDREALM